MLATHAALIPSDVAVPVPRPLVEIVQRHLQDAFGHRHAGGFLYRLGIVLEEEPSEKKGCAGSDDAPCQGFREVADAGFFGVGHGFMD